MVPGAADDVTIDYGTNNFTVTHSGGADSILSLTSRAGLAVSGGELLVGADSHLSGSLTVSATFGGSGNTTVGGLFTWAGGTLQGTGSLTAGGGTAISGPATANLAGGFRYVNPAGQVAAWTAGAVYLNDGSTFENAGTLDLRFDTRMEAPVFASRFVNSGSVTKTGGDPLSLYGSRFYLTVANSGSIGVATGTLIVGSYYLPTTTTNTGSIAGSAGTTLKLFAGLASPGSIRGDCVSFGGFPAGLGGSAAVSGAFEASRTEVAGGDAVAMTGAVAGLGAVTVAGSLDLTGATLAPAARVLASLDLTGSLGAGSGLTVSGPFAWAGGTLQGAAGRGSLTVLSDMTLNGNYTVRDFSLINAGHATWTGGTVQFYGASRFTNTAAATFDDQVDGAFGSADNSCPIFDNQGLFVKSGGTGTTNLEMELDNSGTVRIDHGVLNLGCGYVQVTGGGGGGGSGGSIGGDGSFIGDVTIRNQNQLTLVTTTTGPQPVTNYTQTVTGSLVEQIGGLAAGTQYGQIVVNGDVGLNGTLRVNLINGFTPHLGDTFRVIDDRGANPIHGTFIGLPEGAIVLAGSYGFAVSYVGGTGNDLVLTAIQTTPTLAVDTVTATYDGLAHAATFHITTSDGTDLSSYVVVTYTDASGSTATAAPGLAGAYAVKASYPGSPLYRPVAATGTVTIARASLTVQAADASRTYGAANPTLAATFRGFVPGETLATSGVTGTPALSTAATSASHVGTYGITATAGTLAAANYTFAFAPGTLSLTPAPLTITAQDAAMTYGGLAPNLSAAFAGLVNGDTSAAVSGLTLATAPASSHVGHFPIVASGATESDYAIVYVAGTLTVTPATLTVAADNQARVYGQTNPTLTAKLTGFVNGDGPTAVSGVPSLTTAATTASPVGTYAITATTGTLAAADYLFAFASGTLAVGKASTVGTASVSAATPLFGVDGVALSDSIAVVAPGGGSPTGTVTFYDGITSLGTATVTAGIAQITLGSTVLGAGSHAIKAVYSGDGNFLGVSASTALGVLAPSSVEGLVYVDFNNDGQVDFGEKAVQGVSITLSGTDDLGHAVSRSVLTDVNGVYVFADLRPSNAAGYTIHEVQPTGLLDGRDTLGTVNGVSTGSAAVNDTFSGVALAGGGSLGENYNFGERPPTDGAVVAGETASIGFWQNKNGQALIGALNGGAAAHQLGDWLAATFPNMYANLAGQSNTNVGAFYKGVFALNGKTAPGGPPKMDAQVMATALAVYVTDQGLAGSTASAYGFVVTANGVGTRTFNVGNDGAAFGVANNAVVSVLDLLLAVNARSRRGLLYDLNGDGKIDATEAGYRTQANDLFGAINEIGGQ